MSLRLRDGRPLAVAVLTAVALQGAWAADDSLPPSDQPAWPVQSPTAVDEPSVAAGPAVPPAEPEAAAAARPAWQAELEGSAEAVAQAQQAGQSEPADAGLGGGDASAGAEAAADAVGGGASTDAPAPSKRDPFEVYNRKVYAFNDMVDTAVLRPAAEGYRRAVPELARTGVDNFFGNLADVWSAFNKLLQGKVVQSAQMTLRVATNTVFGLGGLLDPATEFGLERQPEDFGQTLGVWGVPTGPYLMLPILGPSTVRDTAALPLDRGVASPSRYLGGSTNAQVGVTGLQLVAARAGLLSASKLLGDVALDKYAFLRDAYLARRRSQLYDGNPPDEE